MHSAEQIFTVAYITFHKCHMVLSIELVDISVSLEITVFRRHVHYRLTLHQFFMLFPVVLQHLDGDEFHIVLFGQLEQLALSHHRAVILHDLAAEPALLQSCKPQKIDRSLCVAVPFEDSVPLRLEREHMSRTSEILRLCIVICARSRCKPSLCCRYACSRFDMVYRYGERCLVVVSVFADHLRDLQLPAEFLTHRHAYEPLCHACHQVDILRRRKLCRADHIAFIFSVFIIRHQDHSAVAKILKRFLDSIECIHI